MNRKIILPVALMLGAAGPALAGTPGPVEDMTLVGKYTKPGFNFCTKDKANCLKLGGSLQVDYAAFSKHYFPYASAGSKDSDSANNGKGTKDYYGYKIGRLYNGGFIRRARIYVKGKLAKVWKYKIQGDFVTGGFQDVFVQYHGVKNFFFSAGNYFPDFSAQQSTGNMNNEFMEFSQPVQAFGTGRRTGVQANYYNSWVSAAVGYFGSSKGSNITNMAGLVNGRISVTPWNETGKMVNLGIAAYRHGAFGSRNDGPRRKYTVQSRPGVNPYNGARLLKYSNSNDVTHATAYNIEGAAVFGSFDFSAAYMGANVARTMNYQTYKFNGFYVQGGYFLTGESRKWKQKVGKWGGKTTNNNDFGAVQALLRYDSLNLNKGNNTVSKYDDFGKQDNFTVALNYFPTDVVLFEVNYIYSTFKPGYQSNYTPDGGIVPKRTYSQIGARVQVAV